MIGSLSSPSQLAVKPAKIWKPLKKAISPLRDLTDLLQDEQYPAVRATRTPCLGFALIVGGILWASLGGIAYLLIA